MGNTRKIKVTIRRDGVLVDPNSVTLTTTSHGTFTYPSGIVREALGVYSVLLTAPDGGGQCRCVWDCIFTGPPEVRARAVAAYYTEAQ